jgi:hypothetical protein
MGAWGIEAWESDGAADWFRSFFDGIDVNARIEETFSDLDDTEQQVRAACYLLAVLGRVYVWPGDLEQLRELLDHGVQLLNGMLDEDYITDWEGDTRQAFQASVQEQIDQLNMRRAELL